MKLVQQCSTLLSGGATALNLCIFAFALLCQGMPTSCICPYLPSLQRLNHFPGMLEIARKKGLARNLANMRCQLGCQQPGPAAPLPHPLPLLLLPRHSCCCSALASIATIAAAAVA